VLRLWHPSGTKQYLAVRRKKSFFAPVSKREQHRSTGSKDIKVAAIRKGSGSFVCLQILCDYLHCLKNSSNSRLDALFRLFVPVERTTFLYYIL
jgi:hypothetical protein